MIKLENATITGGRRLFGTHVFRGWNVKNCTFRHAGLGYNRGVLTDALDLITDSLVEDCTIERCSFGVAEIRSTTLRDTRGDLLICWGTMFDRVKIIGRFDKLMLHGVSSVRGSNAGSERAAERRRQFYSSVPWALDISEALFGDFSIRTDAVPLNKVILDPISQFVLRRECFQQSSLFDLAVSDYTKTVIKTMLDENSTGALLIAPKLDARLYDAVQDDVAVLCALGLLA